jgi:hypothetical protein
MNDADLIRLISKKLASDECYYTSRRIKPEAIALRLKTWLEHFEEWYKKHGLSFEQAIDLFYDDDNKLALMRWVESSYFIEAINAAVKEMEK